MENRSIFYVSVLSWRNKTQREQHLYWALSKFFNIYYLETVPFKNFKERILNFPIRIKKNGKLSGRNITLITIPLFIPNKFDFLKINDRYIYLLLRIFCPWFWHNNKIIISGTGYPKLPLLFSKFPSIIRYYDCMDNRAALAKSRNEDNPKRIRAIEKKIEEKADVIFLSSSLLKNLSRYRENAIIVNNAVDLTDFNANINMAPGDIPNNGNPIVGYVGAIDSWFDYNLFKTAVLSRPKYNFLLIGDIGVNYKKEFNDILNTENLFILGRKPYRDLYKYINFFDVALIPFKINNITKYVDPLKMYEYLAMGKPIISSALPEVKKIRPYVKIYNNSEEFLLILDEVIENAPFNLNDLKKIAKENTWNKRAEKVFHELTKKIKETN